MVCPGVATICTVVSQAAQRAVLARRAMGGVRLRRLRAVRRVRQLVPGPIPEPSDHFERGRCPAALEPGRPSALLRRRTAHWCRWRCPRHQQDDPVHFVDEPPGLEPRPVASSRHEFPDCRIGTSAFPRRPALFTQRLPPAACGRRYCSNRRPSAPTVSVHPCQILRCRVCVFDDGADFWSSQRNSASLRTSTRRPFLVTPGSCPLSTIA